MTLPDFAELYILVLLIVAFCFAHVAYRQGYCAGQQKAELTTTLALREANFKKGFCILCGSGQESQNTVANNDEYY